MKVGLYLMTSKGLAVLKAALAVDGIEIAHVTWERAAGMDDDSHREIDRIAKQAGIPTFQRQQPPEFDGDWSIAAGWRWMLPATNLVVIHDSLLPRYRGFSPLITALCNGDNTVGVTSFLADEHEYDAGPVVRRTPLAITYPAKMAAVLGRVELIYGQHAAQILKALRDDGELASVPQDHSLATYSVWRDEDDYRIDWRKDDRVIQRQIDACSHPFPGAWTTLAKQVDEIVFTHHFVRILDAVVEPDVKFEQRHPGKVAFVRGGDPVVVCGWGMLRILATDPPDLLQFRTRLV